MLCLTALNSMLNIFQEYLAHPIMAAFKASGYNFSSSGREDVDVRMLGSGRPFIVELINPQLSSLSLDVLENEINLQSSEVKVSNLQVRILMSETIKFIT